MSTLKTAAEPPCTTASGPDLSPGYGSGPQQRFGAIQAPSIVGHGSAWVPMGCAETFVLRLPDNYDQAARDGLAHRPVTARGSRRSLAVVPLIGDRGTTASLP
jgi:hypothetical protein